MATSPDFADAFDAISNPEPFALVSPRDILNSSPDFLLSLSVIDLYATSTNPADIPSALAPVLDDLDEHVTFTTEMVRCALITLAHLMGRDADRPSVAGAEAVTAACQQFTQDAVRLATLTILRDILRNPFATTAAH